MKNYITVIFIVALAAFFKDVSAQEPPTFTVDLGTKQTSFEFSDTQPLGTNSEILTYRLSLDYTMHLQVECYGSFSEYEIELTDSFSHRIAYCYRNSEIKTKDVFPGVYYINIKRYSGYAEEVSVDIQGEFAYPRLSGGNYVRVITPISDGTEYQQLNSNPKETYLYFDGFGRLVQTVQKKISPLGADWVTVTEYDDFGREKEQWLPVPVPGNNGAYVRDIRSQAVAAYGNDSRPFSETIYEYSPLNKAIKQYGPGEDWHNNGKSIKTGHDVNSASDNQLKCSYYRLSPSGQLLYHSGYYAEGELLVSKTEDEDGNTAYEFVNKIGKTILTRTVNNNENHDTYYVYDGYGNLRLVLPPIASDLLQLGRWSIHHDILKQYAYLYRYDHRNRNVMKRIPGCDSISMVYDWADNLIFSQDGEQRKKEEWTFNVYDHFKRLVISGTCKNTNPSGYSDRYVLAEYVNSGDFMQTGYQLLSGISYTDPQVLIINYYDNYAFLSRSNLSSFTYQEKSGYGKKHVLDINGIDHSAKSLLTCSRVKVLNDNREVVTVFYYDKKQQLVQKLERNIDSFTDKEYLQYNYTGLVTAKKLQHYSYSYPSEPYSYPNFYFEGVEENYTYYYDKAGRLYHKRYRIGESSDLYYIDYAYDELGRLKAEKVNTNHQTINYTYNIRGWQTLLQSELFRQELKYNTSSGNKLYNGNISEINGVKYYYDQLNRMTTTSSSGYSEQLSYTKNGSISSLKRRGITDTYQYDLIDNLTYEYQGNQLIKVTDTKPDLLHFGAMEFKQAVNPNNQKPYYSYNANGCMIWDQNKGISSVKYNLLNLPQFIQDRKGNSISYVYDALGRKLKVTYKTIRNEITVPVSETRDVTYNDLLSTVDVKYINNKIFENNKLKMILTEDGYLEQTGDNRFTHNYYFRDYLGSNRLVIQGQSYHQKNDFYPFGLSTETAYPGWQPYKYTGKELETMYGFNLYDFNARIYDPTLGMWMMPDPLAEKYYSITPYAYCMNNPLFYIDPTGMNPALPIFGRILPEVVVTPNGNYAASDSDLKKDIWLYSVFGDNLSASWSGFAYPAYDQYLVGIQKTPHDPNLVILGDQGDDGTLILLELAVTKGAVSGVIKLAETYRLYRAAKIATKTGGNAFRYMTEGELKAIQKTGMLRGGRPGETFFTKDLYKSAANAQNRLALPNTPTLRVEFEILNNPTLLQNGTKVLPANGMIGGGAEFMTVDPVWVRLINWQPLR